MYQGTKGAWSYECMKRRDKYSKNEAKKKERSQKPGPAKRRYLLTNCKRDSRGMRGTTVQSSEKEDKRKVDQKGNHVSGVCVSDDVSDVK